MFSKSVLIQSGESFGWKDIGEVWARRALLFTLMKFAIKSRYRQTFLGIAWSLISPAVQIILFSFVFGGIAKINTGDIPYPLFALSAILLWQYFVRLVNDSTTCLVGYASVLSKVYIPRLIVLLVPIASAFVDFLVGMILVVIALLYFDYPISMSNLVFMPLYIIMATMLAISIGLWVSVTNVIFRDVSIIVPVILQIAFYTTPIVYPAHLIPEKYLALYWLNPMAYVITGFRNSLLGTEMPDVLYFFTALGAIFLVMLPGLFLFKKLSQSMVDKI